jgi:hypothetical protein
MVVAVAARRVDIAGFQQIAGLRHHADPLPSSSARALRGHHLLKCDDLRVIPLIKN